MNKNELVAAAAAKADASKAEAERLVDAVFQSIQETLAKGEDVRLVGFGTFTVTHRAATEGRNPQTGARVHIPASKQPKFKAGKGLKDAVNR